MAAIPSIIALFLAGIGWGTTTASDTSLVEVTSLGAFQQASRLATNPQGWMYVTDVERNLVYLFKDGESSGISVGGYGWISTTFDHPTGLATDGLNLYVADYGNHRLQRFDRYLNFISSFSTRDTSYAAARFGYPLGVALSRLGDLFVLDGENLRVVKFVQNVVFERAFGDIDDQRARLRQPLKIIVAPNDHVFVLEPDRLLEFDYFGQYLRTVGEGTLHDATGFSLSADGLVVATHNSIIWFGARGDVTHQLSAADLHTETPLTQIEDVASAGDRLLILSSTRLHVFTSSTSGH